MTYIWQYDYNVYLLIEDFLMANAGFSFSIFFFFAGTAFSLQYISLQKGESTSQKRFEEKVTRQETLKPKSPRSQALKMLKLVVLLVVLAHSAGASSSSSDEQVTTSDPADMADADALYCLQAEIKYNSLFAQIGRKIDVFIANKYQLNTPEFTELIDFSKQLFAESFEFEATGFITQESTLVTVEQFFGQILALLFNRVIRHGPYFKPLVKCVPGVEMVIAGYESNHVLGESVMASSQHVELTLRPVEVDGKMVMRVIKYIRETQILSVTP